MLEGKASSYVMGIDAGSKTIKIVVLDSQDKLVYEYYKRHQADIQTTMQEALRDFLYRFGDAQVHCTVTGSAGISLAQALQLPYVQEVIAARRGVQHFLPQADVAIELGGEDAKVMYFTGGADQRMNATCAGGTGGFLETLAHTLGLRTAQLDRTAAGYKTIYPIASRCAVFAQTDVRALINQGAAKADIAASVLQAVVTQTISGLACGRPIEGNVAFLGGPFQYCNTLLAFFQKSLGLSYKQVLRPKNTHLFVAQGAALGSQGALVTVSQLKTMLEAKTIGSQEGIQRLPKLFSYPEEYQDFKERHEENRAVSVGMRNYEGGFYLGIDAGSTTIKLVVVDEAGHLLYSNYQPSGGKVLEQVKRMLQEMYLGCMRNHDKSYASWVQYSCVTGYGEELLKQALGVDFGEVETLCHVRGAQEYEPQVDFVLDIGGQDIKCVRLVNGCIDDIALNEACSSGCGALLEGFARSLKRSKWAFAEDAIQAENPVDLGTRCTTFMTSRVRHAQKEGVAVADIAAGLCYSVVRNALYRVLGLTDPSQLGDKVVVQGGTFMSNGVLRAFELVSGKEVVRPSIAPLVGAYGAALLARDRAMELQQEQGHLPDSSFILPQELQECSWVQRSQRCSGCTNNCILTINDFGFDSKTNQQRRLISGNQCSKALDLLGLAQKAPDPTPPNLFALEQKLRSDYGKGGEGALRLGIPQVLELYDSLPFWQAFFEALGCSVVSVSPSSSELFRRGADQVLSESVCYGAKLAHGHVMALAEQGVDGIFMPLLSSGFAESFALGRPWVQGRDCQVSSEYPALIASQQELISAPLFTPDLRDKQQFDKQLFEAVQQLLPQMSTQQYEEALAAGIAEQRRFGESLATAGDKAWKRVQAEGQLAVVLACHPYQVDSGLSHSIDVLLNQLGFAVFSLASLQHELEGIDLDALGAGLVGQNWTQLRRLYQGAAFVAGHKCFEMVQLYSFGCGLDAMAVDVIHQKLAQAGHIHVALKVDEMVDLATVRIRLRSLKSSLEQRKRRALGLTSVEPQGICEQLQTAVDPLQCVGELPQRAESFSRLVCPHVAPHHLKRLQNLAADYGVELVLLEPPQGRDTDTGLRYLNNDLCYPMIVFGGQLIEYLKTCSPQELCGLAVLAPQLCQGCRALEFGAITQRALDEAGFTEVLVVGYPYLDNQEDGEEILQAIQGILEEVEPEFASPAIDALTSEPAPIVPAPTAPSTAPLRIGVAGSFSLALTPALNKNIEQLIRQEGYEPVLPPSSLLLKSPYPLEATLEYFDSQGIEHVIYVQAFGCMTSHIHGRGALQQLKRRFPSLHVTCIEYDPGTSETNQLNRIQLALAVATEE